MCGIAGMVDFNRNIQEMRNTLTSMVKTLEKRVLFEECFVRTQKINCCGSRGRKTTYDKNCRW